MNHRPGHTLIELCVTMSIGSAVMAVAVGLVHQSLSLASAARQRAAAHRVIDRLSRDLRSDVHLAKDVTANSPQQIELSWEDGSVIQYRIVDHLVRRLQLDNGAMIRRDEYALGESVLATFRPLSQPPRVALVLQPTSAVEGPRPSVDREITAVIGRTLAHQRAEVTP